MHLHGRIAAVVRHQSAPFFAPWLGLVVRMASGGCSVNFRVEARALWLKSANLVGEPRRARVGFLIEFLAIENFERRYD